MRRLALLLTITLAAACGDNFNGGPGVGGEATQRVVCSDGDGDGYDECVDDATGEVVLSANADCDDTDENVNPFAPERTNGVDDDCDDLVDCADPTPGGAGGNLQYSVFDGDGDLHVSLDLNGDGVLDSGVITLMGCNPEEVDQYQDLLAIAGLTEEQAGQLLSMFVLPGDILGNDCDDNNIAIYWGAPETCDDVDVDNDCNGDAEEFDGGTDWYPDLDGDGYGDETVPVINSCEVPAAGTWSSDGTDCNDDPATGAAQYPGAPETCADLGTDNNCDGNGLDVDDGSAIEIFPDADADGFAPDGAMSLGFTCEVGPNQASALGDCNDDPATGAAQYPGAPELCVNLYVDNDCDRVADEATDEITWWEDNDSDGFGGEEFVDSCVDPTTPAGTFVPVSGDCNDFLWYVNPEAEEIVGNLTDDNCDGQIDERTSCSSTVFWTDLSSGDLGGMTELYLSVNEGDPILVWPSDGAPAEGVRAFAVDLGDATTVQISFSTCWYPSDEIGLWGQNAIGASLCDTARDQRWLGWVDADSLDGAEPWYVNDVTGLDLNNDALFNECMALITHDPLPVAP